MRTSWLRYVPLHEAVAELVHDGDSVALEGFTHLIPFAAGHELLRQGRRELELIRMTPDILYDQMIGMGAARKLVFSYGGNPGVGSLHRFRDAVEHGWPHPIELEEHSHAGHGQPLRGGRGAAAVRGHARLRRHRPGARSRRSRRSPARSPASSWSPCRRCAPTWRSSTPRRPTARATSSCGGSRACRRRRCSRRRARWSPSSGSSTRLEPRPGGVVIPGWVIDAVAEAPGGSQPVLQPRDHRARQRLLPLLGRAQPRPRRVHGLDAGARAASAEVVR